MSDGILVIPCYNESKRLELDRFATFMEEHEDVGFLFVDDGSTDDTNRILSRWAAEWPGRAAVWCLPENVGKAEAVRRGVLRAIASDATWVGYWDADLSTPLSELAGMRALLDRRPELEMVFGSRVQLLGREIRRSPVRHYLGRTFATTVSLLLGIPVYDTQCGAKLFRTSPVVERLFVEPFVTKWVFDVEIIARLIASYGVEQGRARATGTIAEYPLRTWSDIPGSKLRPRDYVIAVRDLARIFRRYFSDGR